MYSTLKGVPMRIFSSLTAVLLSMAVLPGLGQAQVKFVAFKPETGNDLRHGLSVSLTVKGNTQPIAGTVVRYDQKTNQIYLRTSPGAAPVAIAQKDIVKAEKKVSDKVQFAADGASPDITVDEIQTLEIINGTRRTVSYYAPTLSPGELTQLSSLQSAENEIARLNYLADLQNQVLNNALALQTGQRKRTEMLNQRLLTEPLVWGTHIPGYGYGPSTIVPPAPISPNVTIAPESKDISAARQNLQAAQSRAVFERGRLVAVIDQ